LEQSYQSISPERNSPGTPLTASKIINKALNKSDYQTWKALPNGQFVCHGADRKVLKDEVKPPFDEWIHSELGWKGQIGMFWAFIDSRTNKILYAAQDPRLEGEK
jgi:hypothetical protein